MWRLAFLAGLAGCGEVLNENQPGGDSWLDHESPPSSETTLQSSDGQCRWTGNPYVGARVDAAYVMLYESDRGDCATITGTDVSDRKTVWELRPGDAQARELVDVSGYGDVRLLDAGPGLLMMGETPGAEELWSIDPASYEVLAESSAVGQFWGTRTSPSRQLVAVGDNDVPDRVPLVLIDATTLQTGQLDPGAAFVEAGWLNRADSLVGVSVDDLGVARLARWDLDGVTSVADELPGPSIEVSIPGLLPAIGFSYSWISVDKRDRWAAIPMKRADGYEDVLEILDLRDGTVREVEGVAGPVAFTPDGASIVGWTSDALVVVDPKTLATTRIDLPGDSFPTYFVSHEGNEVLVTDPFGQEDLVLVDLATGDETSLGEPLTLNAFTSRLGHGEVWLVDEGLWRIEMSTGTLESVPLGWTPKYVGWLPQSDLLFLDDAQHPAMVLWDPDAREVVTRADLDARRSAPLVTLARR